MDTQKQIKKAVEATAWNPMRMLNKWGVRSSHAYSLGVLSIGVSMVSWLFSRGKAEDQPRRTHRGLVLGGWAPTFFALGVGLKLEEGS